MKILRKGWRRIEHSVQPILSWFLRPRVWAPGLVFLFVLAAGVTGRWYYTGQAVKRAQRANEALNRGDWHEAEQQSSLLAAAGDLDRASLLRGKAFYLRAKPYIDVGQPWRARPLLARALEEFNKIHEGSETLVEAGAFTGLCLLYLQRRAEAEKVFHYVLARQPDHKDAHRALAIIYYDQGALQQADWHCQAWARLDPGDGRPNHLRGLINKDMDFVPLAISCFKEALQRDLGPEQVALARQYLAELLVKTFDYGPALEVLDSLDPGTARTAEMLALRAECLLGQGQLAKARTLLDQSLAVAVNQRVPALLRARAKIHLQDRQPQLAATLLERAVEVKRHDHQSRHLLAQAYEMLGRSGEAVRQRAQAEETQKSFKRLVELNMQAIKKPWDASLQRQLAELCAQLDMPGVAEDWRQAAARSLSRTSASPQPGPEVGAPELPR